MTVAVPDRVSSARAGKWKRYNPACPQRLSYFLSVLFNFVKNPVNP